jgi:hypothetical protein
LKHGYQRILQLLGVDLKELISSQGGELKQGL